MRRTAGCARRWRSCLGLATRQRCLLSNFPPCWQALSLHSIEEVIGFLMFVSPDADDAPGYYQIWRFMIDHRRQGQGHGRAALALALAEIRARPDARSIEICYKPSNANAKQFYASMGFVEKGLDADGHDMLAVINLA
ncbi:GNAT family N-acetyltransferase [Janthinobacterium sp. SUN073]|uniref:GNAT family N-acetyltransferase n=1 Tax=Janthinobacterium sp. SUN073 TaxID=3004102 RepID=UPI0025B18B58|nr:GNAT family N-acetyltransferase [Janthinobacterium sp. SUN073]MDN2696672.1 GNAT family N-acetyltransferase [Janthinobacterium sp. SUN073]